MCGNAWLGSLPFPEINAGLNGVSALLLLIGYGCIRRKAVRGHVACMIGALISSTLFLICYVTYHLVRAGHFTRFPDGPWRMTYRVILTTHTLLAMVVVPLVIITLVFAVRRQFHRHRRVARITFPIWLYVSVTGVVIYLMLYQLAKLPRI